MLKELKDLKKALATPADNRKLQDQWLKLRQQYLELDAKTREIQRALAIKYGDIMWASAADKKKLDALRARERKIEEKMLEILDAVSPRNWQSGAPSHWIYTKLTWQDATRPLNQPLSVTPPLAYGHTVPMK